jgi:hypothetical protein
LVLSFSKCCNIYRKLIGDYKEINTQDILLTKYEIPKYMECRIHQNIIDNYSS